MEISQPKDPGHPIYRILDKYLERGDLKVISYELEVTQGVVSRVKCGKVRSHRIWQALVDQAMKRKQTLDDFYKDMQSQQDEVDEYLKSIKPPDASAFQ